MKATNYLLAGVLLTLAYSGNAQDAASQTSVKIIHHSNDGIQLFDTVLTANDNYTAKQFVMDKGFDLNTVEMIRTEGAEEGGVWVMEAACSEPIEWHSVSDGDEMRFVVKKSGAFSREIDMEERFVDIIRTGEKDSVDIDREFLFEWEGEVLSDEKGKEVKVVKVINDDGIEETRAWIDGEEVDPSDLKENKFFHEEQGEEIKVRVIAPKEETNGEPVFIRNVIIVEDESAPGELTEFISEDNMKFGEPFTIVLITEADIKSEESVPTSSSALKIDDLNFFPNPNEGRFTLQFNLPHEGPTQIELFNTAGQRVYSEDLGTFNGTYREEIDISDQPAGNYILHITQSGKHLAEKVIVK